MDKRKEKEREGRGREAKGEGRGRRGWEMRRGIVIGGMVIGLLMGCNNRVAELENENKFLTSISNLGKGFLDIFTSLGDMVTNALGIKKDTTKQDIGNYFTDIEKTIKKVKERLNTVVAENGNYEKVKKVVDKFVGTLDKIVEGANEVSKVAVGPEFLGNMPNAAQPGSAGGEIDKLIKGIKTIVEAVDLKEGNPEAGNEKAATDGSTGRSNGTDDAGNLFANNQAGAAHGNAKKGATDAAKAVGAVSGADILQAISQGNSGGAAKLAVNKANHGSVTDVANAKDAVVAGAVALRAMAKGGKFAGQSTADDAIAIVKDAAASAVGKTLSTLIIAIRRTVDSGLKTINEALAAVKQEDMSAEKSEGATK